MPVLLTCKSFNTVLKEISTYIHQPESISLITRAYKFAEQKHKGQVRRNNDPYIFHALSTAYNLAVWKMDPTTIVAGLLHDILEDTPTTYEDIEKAFSHEVAYLVEAVTKVTHFAKSRRAEIKATYLRKLYLSMAKDIRVIIVKLADRLHNIRTIQYLPPAKQKVIAEETLNVYSAIAHRLGMTVVKSELEDRSFKVLDPIAYDRIEQLIAKNLAIRNQIVARQIEALKKLFNQYNQIKIVKIIGRSKNVFSVYRKINYFGKNFDEIYDLLAIRIIVQTVDDCYAALGVVHQYFNPVRDRFKDYIASPKYNLYQSLHTTVVDDHDDLFEVQIRTEQMDDIAESGAAAHWRYKENEDFNPVKKQSEIDEALGIFRDILNLEEINDQLKRNQKLALVEDQTKPVKDESNNFDLATEITHDIFSALIYVLTPAKKVITLPYGATVIDFAYKIHTDIGDKTIGAKVNGRFVPINFVLKSGDIVQIQTGSQVRPSLDWLKIAKTNYARQRIRRAVKKYDLEHEIPVTISDDAERLKIRKQSIANYLEQHQLRNQVVNQGTIIRRIQRQDYKTYDEYLLSFSNDKWNPATVVKELLTKPLSVEEINIGTKTAPKTRNQGSVLVEGDDDIHVNFAQCCHPLPYEAIVGKITKTKGITIHRVNCPNIADQKQLVDVSWNQEANYLRTFLVPISMLVYDRPSLLADIVNLISRLGLMIDSMSISDELSNSPNQKLITFKVGLSNYDKLVQLLTSLKQIPDVLEVKRLIN